MKFLVVGAGVIGLSTAAVLRERGAEVEVWAREIASGTASHAALAVWYPSAIEPRALTQAWAAVTLAELRPLAGDPQSGVRCVAGKTFFHRPMGHPWWRDLVPYRKLRTSELPEGCRAGYAFEVPVVAMPEYLGYLRRRLAALGVSFLERELGKVGDVGEGSAGVFLCAGMGARELAGDETLTAGSGTVEVWEASAPEVVLSSDCSDGRTAVVPMGRRSLVLAGGAAIRFLPGLAGARVSERRKGARPVRKAGVRLELERRYAGGPIVHHYGHGGAGLTLSWGSARAAVELMLGPVQK